MLNCVENTNYLTSDATEIKKNNTSRQKSNTPRTSIYPLNCISEVIYKAKYSKIIKYQI